MNICSVCDEAVEPHTDSLCGACGQTFHLNQRADLPGKDCGEVWINPEHLGLEFTCMTCLAAVRQTPAPAGPLNDILDLAEAAMALGVDPAVLQALAERGDVDHRRTGGGTFLFERSAIEALRPRLTS